jgi:hypothetical protein
MEEPMQPLSAEKILALWETGRPQHALDRALTILAAATPGTNRDTLADLSIGDRDARLLQLRSMVLGPHAEGFAECPRCAERLEFPLETAALEGRAPSRPPDVFSRYETETNGARINFRLPTSRDLAEVVAAPDSAQALRRLVGRCIFTPNEGSSPDCHPEPRRRRGTSQSVSKYASSGLDPNAPDTRFLGALRQPRDDRMRELPDETIEAISAAMLEADPQAETILHLTCPACGHEWDLLFDVVDFFWREISAQAQRLLREIDALARAYGWTEREILNLPAQRRQTYLEMLAA